MEPTLFSHGMPIEIMLQQMVLSGVKCDDIIHRVCAAKRIVDDQVFDQLFIGRKRGFDAIMKDETFVKVMKTLNEFTPVKKIVSLNRGGYREELYICLYRDESDVERFIMLAIYQEQDEHNVNTNILLGYNDPCVKASLAASQIKTIEA